MLTSKALVLIRYRYEEKGKTLEGFNCDGMHFIDLFLLELTSKFDDLMIFIFVQFIASMKIEQILVNFGFLDAMISKVNCQKGCCFIISLIVFKVVLIIEMTNFLMD